MLPTPGPKILETGSRIIRRGPNTFVLTAVEFFPRSSPLVARTCSRGDLFSEVRLARRKSRLGLDEQAVPRRLTWNAPGTMIARPPAAVIAATQQLLHLFGRRRNSPRPTPRPQPTPWRSPAPMPLGRPGYPEPLCPVSLDMVPTFL